MFDFNALFKKAFAVTDSNFDPTLKYYTIFVNCAGKPDYYKDFDNQRRIYLGDAGYEELELLTSSDVDGFRDFMLSLNSKFPIHVDKSFVLLFDFTKNSYGDIPVKDCLDIVHNFKERSDVVSVICILDDEPSECKDVLSALENDISENDILYLYNKQIYHENLLSDSICGVLLLHNSKEHHSQYKNEDVKCKQRVNSTIAGMRAEGQAEIKAKKPVSWNTLGCTFSNPKMDYLRCYVAAMCDKAKKMTYDDYEKEFNELYRGFAEDTDVAGAKALLREVVGCIPRVKKEIPKYDGYTLSDYFKELYGIDGYRTVEYSFKVTLSMRPDPVNDNVIMNLANTMFTNICKYHSEDLFAEVCGHLEEYCRRIMRKHAEARTYINGYVTQKADGDSYELDLDKYIGDYISAYSLQKRCDFWNEVVTYMNNHRQYYDNHCDKSRQLYDQLVAVKRELSLRKAVDLDVDTVKSYSVHDIMNVAQNNEICQRIVQSYKNPEGKGQYVAEINMDWLLKLASPPGFNVEVVYNIITENGGYSATLRQKMGRYLHFMNM